MKKYSSLIAFAVLTVATQLLWGYQLFYTIDERTGFVERNHWSQYCMYALLILSIAGLTVLPFLMSKGIGGIKESKRPVPGAAAALLGGVLVVEAVYGWLSGTADTSVGIEKPQLILYISTIIAALFLVFLGINLIIGRNYRVAGAIAIIPSLWACVRLAVNFMKYTTIANISGNLFDVLMMVFSVLFFFYSAKLIAGVDSKKAFRFSLGFSFCAALFCLMCTVPRFFLNIENSAYETMTPSISDLLIAVYAITFAVSAMSKSKSEDEDDSSGPVQAAVNKIFSQENYFEPEESVEAPVESSPKPITRFIPNPPAESAPEDVPPHTEPQPPVQPVQAPPIKVPQPETVHKPLIIEEATEENNIDPNSKEYKDALSQIYNLIDDIKSGDA